MNVFFFGLGYCARRFLALQSGIAASGTATTAAGVQDLRARGLAAFRFDGATSYAALGPALREAEAIVVSIPPDLGGDAALKWFSAEIAAAPRLSRIVYLSTIGVYGDYGGAWVDETSATRSLSQRGLARLEAEERWRMLGADSDAAVDILRLAGIYGPGRNPLTKLRRGEARRIVKPGHVFNRVHVDDIAQIMRLVLQRDAPGEIWNVADEAPTPPQDLVVYAAELLGLPAPPQEDFEAVSLSPMSASFYADNRRVSIAKAKALLGFKPIYPSYREGLAALAAAGEGRA